MKLLHLTGFVFALAFIVISCGDDVITAPSFCPLDKENSIEIFRVVEEMPRMYVDSCEMLSGTNAKYACANEALRAFIRENMEYPIEAKNGGIEGTVVWRLVVVEDGTICEKKLVQSVDPMLDEEARRIVNILPQPFVVGKQRGRPVRVYINLPISFEL